MASQCTPREGILCFRQPETTRPQRVCPTALPERGTGGDPATDGGSSASPGHSEGKGLEGDEAAAGVDTPAAPSYDNRRLAVMFAGNCATRLGLTAVVEPCLRGGVAQRVSSKRAGTAATNVATRGSATSAPSRPLHTTSWGRTARFAALPAPELWIR